MPVSQTVIDPTELDLTSPAVLGRVVVLVQLPS
jgi:hypothetical protein